MSDFYGLGLWMNPPENDNGYALNPKSKKCLRPDMLIQLGNHEFKACEDLMEARCEELGLL